MALAHRKNGEATEYIGKHRRNDFPKGIDVVRLGNRNRCIYEEGVSIVEDRDSDPNVRRI